jgi:SMC interacting uncharacterized protein involved in chromosome segregation
MDATLQLIMGQFRELKSEICTITAELKTNICALRTGQEALRSDIGSIIEDKVGNCMNNITEGLKAEMNDLRSEVSALDSKMKEGQAELEERFERQQKEMTSKVGWTDGQRVWVVAAVPADGWDQQALRNEQLVDNDLGQLMQEMEAG